MWDEPDGVVELLVRAHVGHLRAQLSAAPGCLQHGGPPAFALPAVPPPVLAPPAPLALPEPSLPALVPHAAESPAAPIKSDQATTEVRLSETERRAVIGEAPDIMRTRPEDSCCR